MVLPGNASGYVYLFRWGLLHKIGRSADPQRRLLEVTDGIDAEIVHIIASSCPSQVEAALHLRFAEVRHHGEWFALAADDVTAISRLARTDAADDLPDALRGSPPDLATVEVKRDLHRMLRTLAGYRSEDLLDFIDNVFRPIAIQMMDEMAADIQEKREGK
jgi:Meiotically Up-regulated Gene 113 (MUG113) protein